MSPPAEEKASGKFDAPKMFMFPELDEDEPVEIANLPESPELVVPDRKNREPLVPPAPAFVEDTMMLPEDVSPPEPDETETDPPVLGELVAAVSSIFPPTPTDAESPSDTTTSPLLPPVAVPVRTTTAPDEPELVVPV